MMVEFTVANVSGLIAAVIYIAQLSIPMLLAFILVGLLRDDNTTTTWSVVGRIVHSTYWPTILGSDSAASLRTGRSARIVAWAVPILLILTAITSIVTPLGLYDSIEPTDPISVPFHYIQDLTAMGQGTPPRSGMDFYRACGWQRYYTCPGSSPLVANVFINETTERPDVDYPYGINVSIPTNITEFFRSGVGRFQGSVSTIWDIEWRTYTFGKHPLFQNGSTLLEAQYRNLATFTINDAVEPVEGLIVDTKQGGIGFRNHSAPMPNKRGYRWSEDLLWVQPETRCVDTNLSYSFTLSKDSLNTIGESHLTDLGGFVNVDHEYPWTKTGVPQSEFNLYDNAYKAAWASNVWSMLFMNVTAVSPNTWKYVNSHVGKTFPLGDSLPPGVGLGQIAITDVGSYLDRLLGNNTYLDSPGGPPLYPNPFNLTRGNFSDIGTTCASVLGADRANITGYALQCGLMYGVPKPAGNNHPLIVQPGDSFTASIYGCATGVRASVKTVDLGYNSTNGTDSLASLRVLAVREKTYTDDELPVWGVERSSSLNLSDLQQLWGLISPEYMDHPEIDSLRSESLWLPGWGAVYGAGQSSYNIPGTDFYIGSLHDTYQLGRDPFEVAPDQNGIGNVALSNKWKDLSSTPDGAARILNLVWTNSAANSVVGTRGWHNFQEQSGEARPLVKRNGETSTPGSAVLVTPYRSRVRYKWLYAIPGVILLAAIAFIGALSFLFLILRRASPSKMRKFLAHTSAGRLMATFLYSEECHPLAKQKEWRHRVGNKRVDVSSGYPQTSGDRLLSSRHRKTNSRDRDRDSKDAASQNVSYLSVPTQSDVPLLDMTRFENARIGRLEDDPAELPQGGGTATPPRALARRIA